MSGTGPTSKRSTGQSPTQGKNRPKNVQWSDGASRVVALQISEAGRWLKPHQQEWVSPLLLGIVLGVILTLVGSYLLLAFVIPYEMACPFSR